MLKLTRRIGEAIMIVDNWWLIRIRRRFQILLGFVFFCTLCSACTTARDSNTVRFRIVAYNVAAGQWTTPQELALSIKHIDADIMLLNEVPKVNEGENIDDWSYLLAKHLGMEHVHVGTVSSANHKSPRWGDITGHYGGKFKSILSRTPLTNPDEFELEGKGWSPASAVRVETVISGLRLVLYSLHLPGAEEWSESKHKRLADIILSRDPLANVILGGDFNEPTDSNVLLTLQSVLDMKNMINPHSIDHILYSAMSPIKCLESGLSWGTSGNSPSGYLSDHPWVWCDVQITTSPH